MLLCFTVRSAKKIIIKGSSRTYSTFSLGGIGFEHIMITDSCPLPFQSGEALKAQIVKGGGWHDSSIFLPYVQRNCATICPREKKLTLAEVYIADRDQLRNICGSYVEMWHSGLNKRGLLIGPVAYPRSSTRSRYFCSSSSPSHSPLPHRILLHLAFFVPSLSLPPFFEAISLLLPYVTTQELP